VRAFTCKAILFDLDGVLVDSAECVERTWRAWATRNHLDPETVIEAAHGRRTLETVRMVAPHLSAEAELDTLAASESTTTEGIYEIEGARELLDTLPAARWGVVTSGIRAVAEFRLRHTRLPVPRVMICADEVEHGKPDPEGYLRAAARLGYAAVDCLVIEDAPAGIESAQAAGMRVIAIATTYPPERLSAADAVVAQLTDLRVTRDGDEIRIEPRRRTVAERRFAEQAEEMGRLGLRERFERIYSTNLWSDPESRSGVGSALDSTRVLRAELPGVLRELEARVLLDVPCGDFTWMEHVDLGGIEYIGGDIVPAIVEENQRLHARKNRRFALVDLTRDELPDADVLICRDCLVHLSYANIRAVLANIARSNIRYVLMTSFPGRGANRDVKDGDWRTLDFQAPPFSFPEPRLAIVEQCEEEDGSYADKSLLAWPVASLRV
jgi:HAD superfamily hydrolase (TIGR01509 family)